MNRNGGNLSTVLPIHPELYYVYNGETNQLGDWEVGNQTITATTPTKYTFTVAFAEPSITGSVYLVGYLKSGTVSGTAAGLDIVGGLTYPSHIDIEAVSAGESFADALHINGDNAMTGDLDVGGNAITNAIVDGSDVTVGVVDKDYLDTNLFLIDGTRAMTGNTDQGGNNITNVEQILGTGQIEFGIVSGGRTNTGEGACILGAVRGGVDLTGSGCIIAGIDSPANPAHIKMNGSGNSVIGYFDENIGITNYSGGTHYGNMIMGKIQRHVSVSGDASLTLIGGGGNPTIVSGSECITLGAGTTNTHTGSLICGTDITSYANYSAYFEGGYKTGDDIVMQGNDLTDGGDVTFTNATFETLTMGGTTSTGLVNVTGNNAVLYTDSSTNLTADINVFSVDDSGNVGIGVAAASNILHVQDGAVNMTWTPNARTALLVENNASLGSAISIVGTNNSTAYSGIFLGNSTNETQGAILYYYEGNANERMSFNTDGQADQMTILKNGYVGINQDSPTNQLEVTGDLYVSGKITGAGGVDPEYMLFDATTRASVKARVANDVPTVKLGGLYIYYNQDAQQLEAAHNASGKIFKFDVTEVGSFTPVTNTYDTVERYYFNPISGEVETQYVQAPRLQWQLKEGYSFNQSDGNFYDVETNIVEQAEAVEQVLK